MKNSFDPETLKIPAYLRNKAIVRQAKQKLILTALDRKEAGLKVNSKKALAPAKSSYRSSRPRRSLTATPASRLRPAFSDSRQRLISPTSSFPSIARSIRGPRLAGSTGTLSRNLNERLESHMASSREPQTQDIAAPYIPPQDFVRIVPIGIVSAYYEKIQVAVINLDAKLKEGDIIQISGEGILFQQPVTSMQIDRKPVKSAKKGSDIGLKVALKPQIEGLVYKVLIEKMLNDERMHESVSRRSKTVPSELFRRHEPIEDFQQPMI